MYKIAFLCLLCALCMPHTSNCMSHHGTIDETDSLLINNATQRRKHKCVSPTATCCLVFGSIFAITAGVMHLISQKECAGSDSSYDASLNCTGNNNVIISSTGGFGYLSQPETTSSDEHACHCNDLILSTVLLGLGSAISLGTSATACIITALQAAYERCYTQPSSVSQLINRTDTP